MCLCRLPPQDLSYNKCDSKANLEPDDPFKQMPEQEAELPKGCDSEDDDQQDLVAETKIKKKKVKPDPDKKVGTVSMHLSCEHIHGFLCFSVTLLHNTAVGMLMCL